MSDGGESWSARVSPSEARSPAPAIGADGLTAALFAAAVALSLIAMLWRLWVEPFDHGYTRYALIAAEMIRSGDWVVERIADKLYFDKPPLQPWLIALPMWWTGSTGGAVQHVPNTIAWAALLGFTYAFGRRWLGERRAAIAAAGVLATSLAFVSLVRDNRLDPLFAAFLTGSFYHAEGFLDAASRRRRLGTALPSWTLLALATLTKGPLALMLFALVIGSYAAWTRRLRRLLAPEFFAGLALFAALVAIWPVQLVRELGLAHTLEALRATALTTRRGGPLYYAIDLPKRFLPWTLLLPAVGAWLATARPALGGAPWPRFALCWLLGVLVPLHFSEAKHYRYALPALPALALLVVALFRLPAARAGATPGSLQARLEVAGLGLPLALLGAAALVSPLALWLRPEAHGTRAVAALPALAGVGAAAWLGLRALRCGERRRAFELTLVGATFTLALWDGARAFDFIAMSEQSDAARAALAPLARGAPARSLHLRADLRATTVLATSRLIEASESAEAVAAWLREMPDRTGFVLTNETGAAQLAATAGVTVARREPLELHHRKLVLLELGPGPPEAAPQG